MRLSEIAKAIVVLPIRFYQLCISPLFPLVAVLLPHAASMQSKQCASTVFSRVCGSQLNEYRVVIRGAAADMTRCHE